MLKTNSIFTYMYRYTVLPFAAFILFNMLVIATGVSVEYLFDYTLNLEIAQVVGIAGGIGATFVYFWWISVTDRYKRHS